MKVKAPASKSYFQRALAISALAKNTSILQNITWCDDTVIAKNITSQLGAELVENDGVLWVYPRKNKILNKDFFAGEAGLSIRMFSPILALNADNFSFTANGSLLNRPVENIIETLAKLGVDIKLNKGKLPLQINKKLQAGKIEIDGSLSSQLLTGLLIALPLVDGNSIISVKNLKSTPYIDMTIKIIQHFGVDIINNNYEEFIIKGNQKYIGTQYNIEGDWSGAAFLLVAGAISNKIEVENLDVDSLQADKKILDALEIAGAKITKNENSVLVEKNQLNAFAFDATHCPDLFPPLVSLASVCEGVTKIKGISRLIYKESNRAKTLQKEFAKMGIKISLQNDFMLIEGGKIKSAKIDSHNDHRIAMAGYLFNILPDIKIEIINREAVNKSYPEFYDVFQYIDI